MRPRRLILKPYRESNKGPHSKFVLIDMLEDEKQNSSVKNVFKSPTKKGPLLKKAFRSLVLPPADGKL